MVIDMKDLEILNEQIKAQILNIYTFDISYTDAENEAFRLVKAEDGYYVWPLFCKPHRTSKFKFEQICRMADSFVADADQREFSIKGWFTYDEFMDNYYNIKGSLRLETYINKFFAGNQRRFAEKQGVLPPQVTQWLQKDMVVVGTKLYSFRRDLIPSREH
jgi:hypothetical protein